MILMGDRGIPNGYRHIHGYYGHTMKFVNAQNEWTYVQIHLKSLQGIKFFTQEESCEHGPDYNQKDLYEAIERGDFPRWSLEVQTMTAAQAEAAWTEQGINVFDMTHIWPQKQFPRREIGVLELNQNAVNYFAEVEQVAFSPSHLVPGIEPSADPVLQSRLFSYSDAHRHRIGTNYQQLPVNRPMTCPYAMGNFQRDGAMAFYNQGKRPSYLSSSDPITFLPRAVDVDATHAQFVGQAVAFLSEIRPEDFNAPRALWERVWDEPARARFVKNISGHMENCRDKEIIKRQIGIFREVSPEIAQRLEKATGVKGYEGIKGLRFNGSHNGMAEKEGDRAANGMERPISLRETVGATNGAPVQGTHVMKGAVMNGVSKGGPATAAVH